MVCQAASKSFTTSATLVVMTGAGGWTAWPAGDCCAPSAAGASTLRLTASQDPATYRRGMRMRHPPSGPGPLLSPGAALRPCRLHPRPAAFNGRNNPLHFFWGEIALQLGKAELFREFWAGGPKAPDERDWLKLFEGDEPILILLDEMPPYFHYLDTQKVGNGTVGDGFKALLDRWSHNVGTDIEQQIKAWNAVDRANTADAPTPYRFKRK